MAGRERERSASSRWHAGYSSTCGAIWNTASFLMAPSSYASAASRIACDGSSNGIAGGRDLSSDRHRAGAGGPANYERRVSMKPSSRRGRPHQTAAPGAPRRTPWCGDRRIVVGTNRRRVSGQGSRSRGSHQLGCPTRRDDQRLAPTRERTGVLNRVKVALATLAADATLTRFPRAHRRAFIGASQETDRSAQKTCVRSTDGHSQLDSKRPHRSLFASLRPLWGLRA